MIAKYYECEIIIISKIPFRKNADSMLMFKWILRPKKQ